MDKALLVTYSRTGTCRELARSIVAESGWAQGDITEAQGRQGMAGYMRSLFDSLQRRKPEIRYIGPPPELFDVVVLLAPVWAWHVAAPMRSFVAEHAAHINHYAVISVMAGSGAQNAEAELAQLTGKLPVYKAAFTARAVLDRSAEAWLPDLVAAIAGRANAPEPQTGGGFTHHPA